MTRSLWAGIRVQQYQPDDALRDLAVPYATFERTLEGISEACKASDADALTLLEFARRVVGTADCLVHRSEMRLSPVRLTDVSMQCRPESQTSDQFELQSLAALAFAICALREAGHDESHGHTAWTDFIWAEICCSLETLSSSTRYRFAVNRSAQGFLTVPLCSLIQDGNIQELFRIHVWLPDGHRGNPDLKVHSHQAFAHSWILAGQATDRSYDGTAASSKDDATHAEYSLAWNSGTGCSAAYKTHQISSTVVNAKRYRQVSLASTRKHSAGMYYTIPHASFHTTEVDPNTLHATLFFFDASRGFEKDAPVLGPRDGNSHTHVREDPKLTPTDLIRLVDLTRQWEACMRTRKAGVGVVGGCVLPLDM